MLSLSKRAHFGEIQCFNCNDAQVRGQAGETWMTSVWPIARVGPV